MRILAIDTTEGASIALLEGETPVAERTMPSVRHHVEDLGPALREIVRNLPGTANANAPHIDYAVVGVGPATYTGLRAGIAIGLGFALGRGIPIGGVLSHHGVYCADHGAYCGEVPATGVNHIVVTDARRKELFWTHYAGLTTAGIPQPVAGPFVTSAEDLREYVQQQEATGTQLRYIGSGRCLYPEVLGVTSGAQEGEKNIATWLGVIAHRMMQAGDELLPAHPIYLREPDAQVPRQMTPVSRI